MFIFGLAAVVGLLLISSDNETEEQKDQQTKLNKPKTTQSESGDQPKGLKLSMSGQEYRNLIIERIADPKSSLEDRQRLSWILSDIDENGYVDER